MCFCFVFYLASCLFINVCEVLSDIVYIFDVGMWCLNCLDLEIVAKEEDAVRWVFE